LILQVFASEKNITEAIEKFSIVKTLQAIEDANVVILVMDAQEGIVEQDLHLLGHAIEKGVRWWWRSTNGMGWMKSSAM
jgi:predicted GTPase